MKHLMGNSPKCCECFFFQSVENKQHQWPGGECSKKVFNWCNWNDSCEQWEDAETRLTAFEVKTGKPGPWRTPSEQEYVAELMRKARERQHEID